MAYEDAEDPSLSLCSRVSVRSTCTYVYDSLQTDEFHGWFSALQGGRKDELFVAVGTSGRDEHQYLKMSVHVIAFNGGRPLLSHYPVVVNRSE